MAIKTRKNIRSISIFLPQKNHKVDLLKIGRSKYVIDKHYPHKLSESQPSNETQREGNISTAIAKYTISTRPSKKNTHQLKKPAK